MTPSSPTTAAIIIIGAEVLSGKVRDENSPFLLQSLRERGIDLKEIRTIDDDPPTISRAVQELSGQYTYVFTTGGIGPTHDDVTFQSVADAFSLPLTQHPHLAQLFKERFPDPKRQEAALRMAQIPEGASVRMAGFVPVVQLQNVTLFPGVPSLLKACFDLIADELRGAAFYNDALFLNVSESQIATHLAEVQRNFPQVSIGSYPQFETSDYRVKVTLDSRDTQALKQAMEAVRSGMDASWVVEPPR
jgi:molybdenum cofactor synthesis domain-containing protein